MSEANHPPADPDPARTRELRQRLEVVEQRIAAACVRAGRRREEITLIVVTKYFPDTDAAALVQLGVRDIGESRDQEARQKVVDLRAAVGEAAMPAVHIIGQVQTKKARSVARYADVVHSLDRSKLVDALGRAAGSAQDDGERTAALQVTIQVDLAEAGDTKRGGVAPAGVLEVAAAVAPYSSLQLRGVMALAPSGLSAHELAGCFQRLAQCAAQLRGEHEQAGWISAGMSGDLESAIAAGATHLRVGSAILGSRPPQR